MNTYDNTIYEVEIDGVKASGTIAKLSKLFGVTEVQNYLSTLKLHYSESKGTFVKIADMDDQYLRNVIAKKVMQAQTEFANGLKTKQRVSNEDFYKYLAAGVSFTASNELNNLIAELSTRIANSAKIKQTVSSWDRLR